MTRREVAWCHDCGSLSFVDEWAESGFVPGVLDVCPECGEVWPYADGEDMAKQLPDPFPDGMTLEGAAKVHWDLYAAQPRLGLSERSP